MKQLFKILLAGVFGLSSMALQGQDNQHLSSMMGRTTLGLGIGLPYGGLGGRIGYNALDNLSIFGGVGYQVVGVGYNVGVLKDFKSSRATQFYLTAMYGTHGAIRVEGASEYDDIYLGFTSGLGIKINSRKNQGNFWDIGLLVPFRSSDFNDDVDRIKNDPRIEDFTDVPPVLIMLGYNFTL